jgi:radical SAM protein with 4Fe4S-binding SPASM domain
MRIVELGRRVGLRGVFRLGVYALQRRRADHLYHLPLYAQIETTRGCNLRCQVCGLSHYNVNAGHMSLEDFVYILRQFSGVQEVMLQGLGEPLLNHDFVEIVQAASDWGAQVDTSTNGTLLTPEIGVGLIDAGLDLMSFSIDGTTPETYELIRRGARFEPVIENVHRMAELKQKRGVNHPHLNVGYILTNHNFYQIPDLVLWAAEVGITKINVWRLQGGETYTDIGELSIEALDEAAVEPAFTEAQRLAAEKGVKLALPSLKRVYNAPICEWPWRGTYVTWDGYVTPCCIMCYPEIYNLGNLFEEDLRDIWNGPAYQQLRAQLRSDDPPFFCRGCPYDVSWMAGLKHKSRGEKTLRVKRAEASRSSDE